MFTNKNTSNKIALILISFLVLIIGCTKTMQPSHPKHPPQTSQSQIQADVAHLPHKEGYVELKTGRLYYQTFGKALPGEAPIIVIHGGPGLSQDYLLPNMLELAKTHEVTFYDQRGTGKSTSKTIDTKTINQKQFVQDLEHLRKHLGYSSVILLGHSWGTHLASVYAMAHPSKVNALLFLNPIPPTYPGFNAFMQEKSAREVKFKIKDQLDNIMSSPKFSEGSAPLLTEFLRLMYIPYVYHADDANKLPLHFTDTTARNGLQIMNILIEEIFNHPYDLRPELAKLNIVTLIVQAKADPIPEWTTKELHEAMPHSTYVSLAKCGHFPHVEQPKLLFKALNAFLKKLPQHSNKAKE